MIYSFNRFQLNEETGELYENGISVRLEPLVFSLLAFLVRNPERIISREELIEVVWKGRIISEAAIDTKISAARAAIGDNGQEQHSIRTVPRRGIRFIAALQKKDGYLENAESNAPSRQVINFCRSADGTSIAYGCSGNGPGLVRVGHWLTHLEYDWRSPLWQPFLNRLSWNFHVLRYDQRGTGLSTAATERFDQEAFVEDLEAVIDAAGFSDFILYGASQGVPIAALYAARHPERVKNLVLQGGYATGRSLRADSTEREQGNAMLTLIRTGWGKAGGHFLKAFSSIYIPDGTQEQIEALVELQRLSASAETAARIRETVDRFDVEDVLENIQVPTLILHSRQDAVQPLEQGLALAQKIPDAQLQILESRNHIILEQEQEWERLFKTLHDFVGD